MRILHGHGVRILQSGREKLVICPILHARNHIIAVEKDEAVKVSRLIMHGEDGVPYLVCRLFVKVPPFGALRKMVASH